MTSIYSVKVTGTKRKNTEDEEAEKFEFTAAFKPSEQEAAKEAVGTQIKFIQQLIRKQPTEALKMMSTLNAALELYYFDGKESFELALAEYKLTKQ